MDQVLKDHKLLRLNQDEIDNLKSSITMKEINVIFFKSSPEPDGEFYQTFEELAPILYNLFQEMEEEENFQTHFMRQILLPIPKLYKDSIIKENYRPISFINLNVNILNKMLAY